jgi:hypothetical protein
MLHVDDSPKAREALLTLRLPPEIEKTAREIAFGIREKLLPLLPANIAATKGNGDFRTAAIQDSRSVIYAQAELPCP